MGNVAKQRKAVQNDGYNETQNGWKLLLLGTPNSGKTTFLHQLRIIYNGCTKYDILNNIAWNIVNSILYFSKHVELNERDIKILKELVNDRDTIWYQHKHVGNIVKNIFNDNGIQRMIKQKPKDYYYVKDMEYLYNNPDILFHIDCFKSQNITKTSLLKWYIKTFGNNLYTISWNTHIFDVCEVNNIQYSELHSKHVAIVMYMVSLDDYCKTCMDNPNKNAMIHSIEKFKELTNSKWFDKPQPLIKISFNKMDLFKEQLRKGFNINIAFSNKKYSWNINDNYYPEIFLVKIIKCYSKNINITLPNDIITIIMKHFNTNNFNDCSQKSLQFIAKIYKQQCKNSEKIIYHGFMNKLTKANVEQNFAHITGVFKLMRF